MILSLLKEINQEVQITKIEKFHIYDKTQIFLVTKNKMNKFKLKKGEV